MGLLNGVGFISNPTLIVLLLLIFFKDSLFAFLVAFALLVVLTLDTFGLLNLIIER